MHKIKQIRKLKEKIKGLIEDNNVNEAKILLKKYIQEVPYDLEYYIIMGVIRFIEQDLQEAEKSLLYAYNKLEFNFEVNYNLGIVYMYMGSYEKALEFLLRSLCIDNSKKDLIFKDIETIYSINKDTEKLNYIKENILSKFVNYQRQFPKKGERDNYAGKYFIINNEKYFTGIYDYYSVGKDGVLLENVPELINTYKTETLRANEYVKHTIETEYDSLMPIMVLKNNQVIKIYLKDQDKEILLDSLLANRYYYYRLPSKEIVDITSDEKFILGDLIELNIKDKPKLILNVFVDGLSKDFIKDESFKSIMPNTFKFFKEGTICDNAYVSGEWTYPSIASIFTGLYTTNHRVFNPDYDTNHLINNKIFSEIFKENGYFTAQINGEWRSTPILGYIKGIDRYVYQPAVRGMYVDEIISETVEHLEAFSEGNNFLWVGIPDLHDIADEYEGRVSIQTKLNLKDRIIKKTDETSVRKKFDVNKINKYKIQLKRIDSYLQLLYSYILNNYNEDEYIVTLISDHGQGYLIETDKFLEEQRTKVPMMLRGKNIPKGVCAEMVQGLDLFPIVLNAAGINNADLKDGNIPKYFGGKEERKFTYTESIFPGSVYRAVINDLDYKLFFETKENCQVDGRFKIDGYTVQLINKNTNKNETEVYKEKVDGYLKIVFEHIKEHIIF
ncbi:sulfatase-like hydrolase/transferase [Clostridium botulinum]|uniref:sulfatase-like hydrolase/transferase n=1 Tax=Clostridium botulinum TaxID=1491 RepID=UPI0006A46624|nr:sulfatase-like hydrolase/transferase [Clostridium botulinum]KOC33806.1 sulfatase [Clostridium botulinum]